ncbi:transposase [Microcoleus sp. Pol17_C1]
MGIFTKPGCSLEEVSIDLWKGYRNLVIDLMPKAQVVAD